MALQKLIVAGDKNFRVQVMVDDPKEATAAIEMLQKKLKNVRPVFKKWRDIYLITLVQRFMSEGGKKNWPSLSELSTLALRQMDITRVKDYDGKPRMGGLPINILRSRFGDYMQSWVNESHQHHAEEMQTNAMQSGGAVWSLANKSVKTVHETGLRSIKGPPGFRGKRLPKREVTWLKDEKLLKRLMTTFDDFVWPDFVKATRRNLVRINIGS